MVLQVSGGIGGEEIDELQVEKPLVAVHKAAVHAQFVTKFHGGKFVHALFENAGEAPSLTESETRCHKTTLRCTNTIRSKHSVTFSRATHLALAQAGDEAACPVRALDAVHEQGAVVGRLQERAAGERRCARMGEGWA